LYSGLATGTPMSEFDRVPLKDDRAQLVANGGSGIPVSG
jgi:hypothetical protein